MNLSPIRIIDESSVEFYLSGKSFTANTTENTIVENETISNELMPLAWAVENFNFSSDAITWYKGIYKMYYSISENAFYMGNAQVLDEGFVNYIMAAGVIRYDEKPVAEAFVNAAKNIDKFVDLDFVKTIKENNNLINVMRMGDNLFVSRINETAKLYNFFQAKNANELVDYVNEKTNTDISTFVADLLEGDAVARLSTLSKIEKIEEMISFLKDQRNLLADADRAITEIRSADALIEGEIEKFTNDIKELKASL